jgi:hypothetical protein
LSRHGAARQALNELATAKERKYLDEEADVEAAAGYYAAIDPDAEAPALFAALSTLVQESHGVRPGYSPAVGSTPGSTSSRTESSAASTPRKSSTRSR